MQGDTRLALRTRGLQAMPHMEGGEERGEGGATAATGRRVQRRKRKRGEEGGLQIGCTEVAEVGNTIYGTPNVRINSGGKREGV